MAVHFVSVEAHEMEAFSTSFAPAERQTQSGDLLRPKIMVRVASPF
jgi:hypothetical protein